MMKQPLFKAIPHLRVQFVAVAEQKTSPRWAAVASALSIALLMGCAYWYNGRETSTIFRAQLAQFRIWRAAPNPLTPGSSSFLEVFL